MSAVEKRYFGPWVFDLLIKKDSFRLLPLQDLERAVQTGYFSTRGNKSRLVCRRSKKCEM
jgi:hypothetical protein